MAHVSVLNSLLSDTSVTDSNKLLVNRNEDQSPVYFQDTVAKDGSKLIGHNVSEPETGQGDSGNSDDEMQVSAWELLSSQSLSPTSPRDEEPGQYPKDFEALLLNLGARRGPQYAGRAGARAAALQVIEEDLPVDGSCPLFYVYDLGLVCRLYSAWLDAMPRVHPFYAVKCNPDLGLLSALAALGSGFDCASGAEMETVLGLGVPPSRMIFANPAKFHKDLLLAAAHGIPTTFDSEHELHKIARVASTLPLLLRVRSDDPSAVCALGNKYGAEPEEVEGLLATAHELGLNVVGCSFHVGSGARDPLAYATALSKARMVFDTAKQFGYNPWVLDIGGGMSTATDPDTGAVMFGNSGFGEVVSSTLEHYFPPEYGPIRVIGEPGRYFAQNSAIMVAKVFACRHRKLAKSGIETYREYWISDGIYGSFNFHFYDTANGKPKGDPLRSPHLPMIDETSAIYKSCVWGPTCDGLDCVESETLLPELREGDWLVYHKFGSYTIAGAKDFNGINVSKPHISYVCS